MKEILYVCVKNPFVERDMDRMGIEALERHFDVRILDCTAWLMPLAFKTRENSTLNRDNIFQIESRKAFRKALEKDRGGYALDYVGQFSISAILLFNELKSFGVKIVAMDSGACPMPTRILGQMTLVQKVLETLVSGGIRQHINARLTRLLLKILPDQGPDFVLTGGTAWKQEPRFIAAKQKIPAHSFDYEKMLSIRDLPPLRSGPYAVYIEEDITDHEDNLEMGVKSPATAERFFPKILAFFDEFEKRTGIPIVIAAYPSVRSAARTAAFWERPVVVGETGLLVRDSALVFSHASTAISFAVMYRKPLISLTSNEIAETWYQPWVHVFTALLGNVEYNIDSNSFDPETWFDVDHEKYATYEATYIKSDYDGDRSLWEILSDIQNLNGVLVRERRVLSMMSVLKQIVRQQLNSLRKCLYCVRLRCRYPHAVFHEKAIADPQSTLGDHAVLFPNVRLMQTDFGAYSYAQENTFIANAEIGPFCSIAANVSIGLLNHPTDMVSTSPVLYDNSQPLPRFLISELKYPVKTQRTIIGADVWIGDGVKIMAGVKIGVGAIIGSGAVVTKDVPSYTIVAGLPARPIRKRFDEGTCQKLEASKWWEESEAYLQDLSDYFTEPDKFLQALGAKQE